MQPGQVATMGDLRLVVFSRMSRSVLTPAEASMVRYAGDPRPRVVSSRPAAYADIPEFHVRNIGILKIIRVFGVLSFLGDAPVMLSILPVTPRTRRAYDHRLREHVVRSGAISLMY
jgi:hypothetical protein